MDFETLAEDVRKLASDIEENGRTILAGSLELRAIVRQAGAGLAEFESAAKSGTAADSSAGGGQPGGACGSGGTALREASREMAARYDAVRREIGELVMSLQVHDITRQQMEHAATALGAVERGDAAGPVAGLLVRVCGLQRAQLEHSRESFLSRVRRVRESLAGICPECLRDGGGKHRGAGKRAGNEDSFLGGDGDTASPGFARPWRSMRNRGMRSRRLLKRWRRVCERCRSSWRRSKRSASACNASP